MCTLLFFLLTKGNVSAFYLVCGLLCVTASLVGSSPLVSSSFNVPCICSLPILEPSFRAVCKNISILLWFKTKEICVHLEALICTQEQRGFKWKKLFLIVLQSPDLETWEETPGWEDQAQEDWDPDTVLKEKRHLERQRRLAEQQQKRQKREQLKVSRPIALGEKLSW